MRDEWVVAEPATAPGHSVVGLRVRELGRAFVDRFPATSTGSAGRRTPYLQPTTAGQPSSAAEHGSRTVAGGVLAECVRPAAVTEFLGPDCPTTGGPRSVTRRHSDRHVSAEGRYRTGTRAAVALSAKTGARNRSGASADGIAKRRPRAAQRRGRPACIQATGSLVSSGNRRFVRGSSTTEPASWQQLLTIRSRATILRWTSDYSDTVVARGHMRRARVEPVVRREIAAGSTRSDRCAEGHPCGQLVAALAFRVTNATSACRSGFAERQSFGAVDPASLRSLPRRSAPDRRSPVRWRAVAE